MIRVVRTAKPDILVSNEERWKADIANAQTPKELKVAQGKYAHKKIRVALSEMFHDKCAYCESHITHVSYADIEHFRPKSKLAFYTQAVEWSNLLLACGRCNGPSQKGVKFPTPEEGGPLLDPTIDEPATHLTFEYDVATGLANVHGTTERGSLSEEIFGLNRPELLRHRSKFVKKLKVIADYYQSDTDAKALIDAATLASEEYSAFALVLRLSANEL